MPGFRSLAVLVAAALLLGGCGWFRSKKPPPPCPRVVVLEEGKRLVNFAPGGGTDLSAMVSDIRMARAGGACTYRDGEVEVEMAVRVEARRGPADRSRKAAVKYFIVLMDPTEKIIKKWDFDMTLAFPVNVDQGGKTDTLGLKIPLKKGEQASRYRIIAGLQLTPAQLKYNRDWAKVKTPGALRDIPIAPPARGPGAREPDFPVGRPGSGGAVPGEPN
ncbi:MAG: hypothetical protein OEO83_07430 [Alphaproteobacteria bacterium]|nr:hypothetical protein [Alphaproteobacteria bacterium]